MTFFQQLGFANWLDWAENKVITVETFNTHILKGLYYIHTYMHIISYHIFWWTILYSTKIHWTVEPQFVLKKYLEFTTSFQHAWSVIFILQVNSVAFQLTDTLENILCQFLAVTNFSSVRGGILSLRFEVKQLPTLILNIYFKHNNLKNRVERWIRLL